LEWARKVGRERTRRGWRRRRREEEEEQGSRQRGRGAREGKLVKAKRALLRDKGRDVVEGKDVTSQARMRGGERSAARNRKHSKSLEERESEGREKADRSDIPIDRRHVKIRGYPFVERMEVSSLCRWELEVRHGEKGEGRKSES